METKIDITKMQAEDFKKEFKGMVLSLESVRAGGQNKKPVDISFEELVQGKWGISLATLFEKIEMNPKVDTMQNIFDMPNQDIRWIVPEIIRAAITTGMREAPFYPTIIQGDQPINGLTAIQPWVNMSDAAPAKINEAETIPLGTVSFGQKSVTLFKIGKGFKLTDEVRNYVSIDILGIYLRDFGIQLGYALDTLALDTLLLGNKPDGSEAADVVGVTTANTLTYKDMLRIWIRGARIGRNFTTMISAEDIALSLLDLPEFKHVRLIDRVSPAGLLCSVSAEKLVKQVDVFSVYPCDRRYVLRRFDPSFYLERRCSRKHKVRNTVYQTQILWTERVVCMPVFICIWLTSRLGACTSVARTSTPPSHHAAHLALTGIAHAKGSANEHLDLYRVFRADSYSLADDFTYFFKTQFSGRNYPAESQVFCQPHCFSVV